MQITYSTSMVHGDIAQFLSMADGATAQQDACMMMAAGISVVCNVLRLLFIITSASSELWSSLQKLVWSGTQR